MAKRHLLIAGTGRAGTTFLVQYLHALGLETHLSRKENKANYDASANAGFEDTHSLLSGEAERPYVMKSPWLYEFVDRILADESIIIDAVIIPVRDIVNSARSRVTNELFAMHRANPWMQDLDHTWETWGTTPGGLITSLNPLDQARLLALEFHRLLEKLVKNNVRVVMLHFPTMIEDPTHIYEALLDFIPRTITKDAAVRAHANLADASKLRTEEEVAAETSPRDASPPSAVVNHGSVLSADNSALKRMVKQLRKELDDRNKELWQLRSEAVGYLDGLSNTEKALQKTSQFWRTQVLDAVEWGEKELERHPADVVLPLLVRHFRVIAGEGGH